VAALAALLFAAGYVRRSPREARPIFANLASPEKLFISDVALSPDGSKLAFCAVRPGGAQPGLWIRSLSDPAAKPVAGAEDAIFPFWSPDGRYVAFFGQGSLKRVEASGGPVLTICDAERGVGGTWGPDGTILFAPKPSSPLLRVLSSGGTPVPVTKLDARLHVTAHRYPKFMPDSQHFLYMTMNPSAPPGDPQTRFASARSTESSTSPRPGRFERLLRRRQPFFTAATGCCSRKIDLSRWEMKGDPATIGGRVSRSNWFGYALFTVSGGTLVYLPNLTVPLQLTWFDRNGRTPGGIGEPGVFTFVRVSPDGRRIAADVFDTARNSPEVWIFDAASGVGNKFASSNFLDMSPVWSPDGDRIAFASSRRTKGGNREVWVKRLDGSPEEPHPCVDDCQTGLSTGGFSLPAMPFAAGPAAPDLDHLETGGGHKGRSVLTGADADTGQSLFPGWRWLTFASNNRKIRIYVRPSGGAGRADLHVGRRQSVWSATGRATTNPSTSRSWRRR
jgi:dipeptidyl aminopeptidase/acylaminoacyl peptidase